MGRKKFFKIFLQKYIDFTYEPTFSTVAVSVTGANFLASWRYTEIVGRWTLTSVPFPTVYALANTTLASALIRAFDSIYLQREDQKHMIRYKIRAFKKILHHLIAYRTFTKFSFVSIIAEAFSTNAFPPLMAHLGRITFNALLYIIHRRSFVAIAYFAYRFHPDVKRMLKETFTEKKKKKEWIKISYRTSQCHIRISRTRSFRVGNKNFQYFYNNCNRKKVQCQLLSLMLQKPMHPRL